MGAGGSISDQGVGNQGGRGRIHACHFILFGLLLIVVVEVAG